MPLPKEEQKQYIRNLVKTNKKRMFEYLGHECKWCGSAENLEVDHVVNEPDKRRVVGLLGGSWKRLKRELDKCQVLCRDCHQTKSIIERGDVPCDFRHGRVNTYMRGCRCEQCKEAIRAYDRKRRAKNRKKKT